MSKPARDRLYEELATIVAEYQPQPVAGSVTKKAWNKVKKDAVFSERYPSPYSFCFDLCLTAINKIAQDEQRKARVFYAINDQYLKRAQLVSEAYEASQRYLEWIVALTPNTPDVVVPLQVADMLAYEVYHHHQAAQIRPQQDLLARLEYPFIGYEYDEAALRKLIAGGPAGMVE